MNATLICTGPTGKISRPVHLHQEEKTLSAEASAVGFPPGVFPFGIKLLDETGSEDHFVFADTKKVGEELLYVLYFSERSRSELVIWND